MSERTENHILALDQENRDRLEPGMRYAVQRLGIARVEALQRGAETLAEGYDLAMMQILREMRAL